MDELCRESDKLSPEFLPLLFTTYAGVRIPELPPEDVQRNTVGESGLSSLTEGYRLFRFVRDILERFRFFLTAYDNCNVRVLAVLPAMIEYCRSLIRVGQYACISGRPWLDFPDRSIDVLYAYSVFSHLSDTLQDSLGCGVSPYRWAWRICVSHQQDKELH
jgi:hypothetical protein